jgi:trimethylamine:corrinoid methyltransferase-like protein
MVPELRVLSSGEIASIFDRVLEFLSKRGVKIKHKPILKLLDEAGAWVNSNDEMVRFPRGFVEDLLKKTPHHFSLAAVDEKCDMPCPPKSGSFYMFANSGASTIIDPDTGTCRDVCISDVRKWGQLVGTLTNIDSTGFQTPSDVPPESIDVHSLRALLENTSKHVWIQPHSEGSIRYLMDLVIARAGGEESLRERPIASVMSNSLTPFVFESMDIEVISQACRCGIPIHVSSLPVAGGTSPVTIAGSILVAGIEVLAQVVIAQLIKPGIPVIGLSASLAMDMFSGKALKASVEAIQSNAGFVQFMKEAFEIPTHSAGITSDSPILDGQSMIERSLRGLMISGVGADMIGRAGELEGAKIISPLQLIIDDEITAMLKRIMCGIEFNEETAGWDDILAISPGGHFLMEPHTLIHCRNLFRPHLFVHRSGEVWKDLIVIAQETYRHLSARADTPTLSPHTCSQMDLIVREADRELIH